MPADITNDHLDQHNNGRGKEKLPTSLNVITILTFIGCAISLYSTITNFMAGNEALVQFEEQQQKLNGTSSWAGRFLSPEAHEMLAKSLENKVPLCIIGLISIALCIYGAIEMRRLKKQGYYLWLTGEILPYIGFVVFVGTVFFQTIYFYFMIVPLLFIILYSLQRKHLKY